MVLDAIFYKFPEFDFDGFGDFHLGKGFFAQMRGLAVGFQKGDTGGAILEMVLQRVRRFGVQGTVEIIAQQFNALFTTNHFFSLRD